MQMGVSSANMNKGTILVIDEVPENLRSLQESLAKAGYTVRTAADAEEVMQGDLGTLPDLILLSAALTHLDSYQVCQHIKFHEATRHIPVIFVSPVDASLDRVKIFAAGGDDYLVMPFQAGEVIARIETHLSLQHLVKPHDQHILGRTQELEDANARLKLEITRHQRTEKALNRANRAYKALSACSQALRQANDEPAFLQEICRVIIDVGGYRMVWAGYAQHDADQTIHPEASAGAVEGYLDELDITWADTPRGRNPISAAIRTGQPGVAQHILTTPRQEPWRELAKQRDYASMIALPLRAQDSILGALCIYSREPDAFDDEETNLLLRLADDVTYGVIALRTQVVRKWAEAALRESEHFTKTVVSSVGEGVVVVDRDLRCKVWNGFMETLTGLSAADVLGQRSFDVFPFLREQGIDKLLERALTGETVRSADIPFHIPQTEKAGWMVGVFTPHVSIGGEIIGVVATVHDITERKRAEAALADERNLLRTLIDNVPDYIFVKDRQGRFVISNIAHAAGAGSTPGELVGKVAREVFPSSVAEQFHDDDEHVIQTGQAMVNEERLTTGADGNPKWVLTTKVPLRNPQGEITGLVGVSHDITGRKRAQEALQESEQNYRALYRQAQQQAQFTESLLQHLPVGVILLNTEGQIEEANPKLCDMVGYSEDELKYQGLSLILPGSVAEQDALFLQKMVEGKSAGLYESEGLRKDGSRFPARIQAAHLKDSDGRAIGVLSTIEDITQYIIAEEARRTSEMLRIELEKEKELLELKTRFVSMASHEFRTPLATIQATSETLQYYFDKLTPERREQRFEKIHDQIRHLVALLDDVLTIGKIEADAIEFNPESVDLNDFIPAIIEEFRESGTKQELVYTCEDGTDFTIDADKKLLRQIVANLISNAVKYSPTDCRVQIQMSCADPNRITLQVIDTGIGIPEEDQKRLFSNFFRASNTTGISGTGLGLAIAKHATELHSGQITCQSKENMGSAFTVSLPRTQNLSRINENAENSGN